MELMEIKKIKYQAANDVNQRREWIKFQLRIRGTSLALLARENGVSRQAMSAALVKPSKRCEQPIAHAIGMQPHEVWPERYEK